MNCHILMAAPGKAMLNFLISSYDYMEANWSVAEAIHVPHFNLICRVCFASSA